MNSNSLGSPDEHGFLQKVTKLTKKEDFNREAKFLTTDEHRWARIGIQTAEDAEYAEKDVNAEDEP